MSISSLEFSVKFLSDSISRSKFSRPQSVAYLHMLHMYLLRISASPLGSPM
ncbi:hypothetical protein OF001_U220033 [Pseudomonas sp. OF001]|nr:hypothetical protein OF001_U220033 [Pseudomonas sp. OF001]